MKSIVQFINEAKAKLAKLNEFNSYKFGEGDKCILDLNKSDKIWFISFVREEIIQINGFEKIEKDSGYNDWHCWSIIKPQFSKETYDYLCKSIKEAENDNKFDDYLKLDDGDLSVRYFRTNIRKKDKKDGFVPYDSRFSSKNDLYSMLGVFVFDEEILNNFMEEYPNYKLHE